MKKAEIKKIIKSMEKDAREEARASIEMTYDAEQMMYICLGYFEDYLAKLK